MTDTTTTTATKGGALNIIKGVLSALFSSKKFCTFLVGVVLNFLSVLMVTKLGLPMEQAIDILTDLTLKISGMTGFTVVGFAAQDWGKEAAKAKADGGVQEKVIEA